MKKILILLFALSILSNIANAQYRLVENDTYFAHQYGTADTVVKDGSETYALYVRDFAKTFKLTTSLSRITGDYTKSRVIISESVDASNWTAIDTILFAGTGATITNTSSLNIDVFSPYIKVVISPYDSTQTLRGKHYFIIEKN